MRIVRLKWLEKLKKEMSNQKKIKVIKRRHLTFSAFPVNTPINAPNSQAVGTSAVQRKRVERELADRVKDWVFDWRDRKQKREFKDTVIFSKGI